MKSNPENSLLILGRGYVGSAVDQAVSGARWTRKGDFELGRRETWKKSVLDGNEKILWTFPAASTPDEEAWALELYDTFFKNSSVVVYGSVSAYPVAKPGEWVTEETPLDMTQVRVRTEERLRERGACILQLAGIFGPGRDPVNWYQRGWIQAGLSYLNLIHLQDIVSVTLRILEHPQSSGERFNVSNGSPKTHFEIVEALKAIGKLPVQFSLPAIQKTDSKKVSHDKLKQFLSLHSEDFIQFPE